MSEPRLCKECQEFDEMMNGGSVSFDVYVECNHPKEKKLCSCGKLASTAIVGKDGLYPRCHECIGEVFGI